MLVLTRKNNEELVLTGGIRIRVLENRGSRVRLGITAPPEVEVCRGELLFAAGDETAARPQNDQLQTAVAEPCLRRTLAKSRRRSLAAR